MTNKPKCKEGSANIFADLGILNPEETLAKAEVVRQIQRTIKKKRLTQTAAAKILGIAQPKVSRLLRGYFENFSLERLFRFLNKLGQDIRISISDEPHRGKGHTSIEIGDFPSNIRIAALGRDRN
jgi:predicted XRE-type DNA-binding protein